MTDHSTRKQSGGVRFFKWLWRRVSHNFGYTVLAVLTAVLIWIAIGLL